MVANAVRFIVCAEEYQRGKRPNCEEVCQVYENIVDDILIYGERRYRRKPLLTVQSDASQTGLGAAVMQEDRPVVYASRALTDTEKQEKTLISHEIPSRPWSKVGIDLMTFQSKNYLVTVIYYSNLLEVDYLEDTLALTVIRKLRAQLQGGIPMCVLQTTVHNLTVESLENLADSGKLNTTLHLHFDSQSNGKGTSSTNSKKVNEEIKI
ncbi:unnamed protein product [Mytilus coruscus]|uniref:Reverse transcriptase RNase H-like domain-containing protein n=1 Tax=Mytilus coruscus TaxID=42192 RepID=A0A6J8B1L4_MYTCO|nr:unnamed protein product [Mytilus coruscus]